MSGSLPIVVSVERDGDTITVKYADGHRAKFIGFREGLDRPIDGLMRLYLYNGDDLVVHYNGRLFTRPSDRHEHKFIRVATGYTHDLIARYWEASDRYFRHRGFQEALEKGVVNPDDIKLFASILEEGFPDYQRIKKERIPMPVSVGV